MPGLAKSFSGPTSAVSLPSAIIDPLGQPASDWAASISAAVHLGKYLPLDFTPAQATSSSEKVSWRVPSEVEVSSRDVIATGLGFFLLPPGLTLDDVVSVSGDGLGCGTWAAATATGRAATARTM